MSGAFDSVSSGRVQALILSKRSSRAFSALESGPSPTVWQLPQEAVCTLPSRTGHSQICVLQDLGSLLFPSVSLFVPKVRNWIRNTRSSRTRVSHNHFPAVVIALRSLGKTRAPWPRSHCHVHFTHLFKKKCAHI